jgi:hypothetical protein
MAKLSSVYFFLKIYESKRPEIAKSIFEVSDKIYQENFNLLREKFGIRAPDSAID